jgi:hypothetical protein
MLAQNLLYIIQAQMQNALGGKITKDAIKK